MCVGIDVSAQELVVAIAQQPQVHTFGNHPAGHRTLIEWLLRQGKQVRVCLEASGNYSLDVSLALHRQKRVDLEVVNPRVARRFAQSLGHRSKDDPVDSHALAEYAARMPFQAWQAPSVAMLQLRSLARTIAALTHIAAQEKNRTHAASASEVLAPMVAQELGRHTRYLEHRLAKLRQKAQRIVEKDPQLQRRWRHLLSTPGIGEVSALQNLGGIGRASAHAGCPPMGRPLRSGPPASRFRQFGPQPAAD